MYYNFAFENLLNQGRNCEKLSYLGTTFLKNPYIKDSKVKFVGGQSTLNSGKKVVGAAGQLTLNSERICEHSARIISDNVDNVDPGEGQSTLNSRKL